VGVCLKYERRESWGTSRRAVWEREKARRGLRRRRELGQAPECRQPLSVESQNGEYGGCRMELVLPGWHERLLGGYLVSRDCPCLLSVLLYLLHLSPCYPSQAHLLVTTSLVPPLSSNPLATSRSLLTSRFATRDSYPPGTRQLELR
jgi:hypothetical protein